MPDEAWSSVRRDLAAFSDLGADVAFSERGKRLEFSLPRNGTWIDGVIDGAPGRRRVQLEGAQGSVPYADFLASEQMGNLRRLARQTTLLERELRAKSKKEIGNSGKSITFYECFVPPRISVDGHLLGESGLEALDHLVRSPDDAVGTRLAFLAAQAGQGKSSLLDVFTITKAKDYLEGRSQQLCLYVDAQGRGLARLDEAIARQLNDLQFMLSYNAIVSLVREGLLVLVVDGFDELIGSRGTYDDAFGSLSNFIETLEGQGTLLAATRSSYFTQEYGSRGAILDGGDSFAFELILAELCPWDASSQLSYFDSVVDKASLSSTDEKRARKDFKKLQDADEANLLSRPLFARDLTLLILQGSLSTERGDIRSTSALVTALAASYIEREVENKLLTRDRSEIVSVGSLMDYYVELASDMWRLETRELDARTAKESAELQAEVWELRTEGRDIFLARYASLPFLVTDSSSGAVVFEHEVFFSFFLAKHIAPALVDGSLGNAQALLSKAALDETGSEFVAADVLSALEDGVASVERVSEVASSRHPREVQIRGNCGSLVSTLLRTISIGGTEQIRLDHLRDLRFAGRSFEGVDVFIGELANVEFVRCDFPRSTIVAESARNVVLREPLVDPDTTVLRIPGLSDFGGLGLRVVDDSGLHAEYDSAKVLEVLRKVGLASDGEIKPLHDVDPDLSDIVAAIAHAYERMNPIGSLHTRVGHLFTDKASKPVVRLLLEHGLVVTVTKSVKGPPQEFYRKQFVPSELMDGLWTPTGQESIDSFWSDLATV